MRETWCPSPDGPIYRATEEDAGSLEPDDRNIWKPSIHMPRWASRLTLEVVAVRVERVQEIAEADAMAEGVEYGLHLPGHPRQCTARWQFMKLWDSINAARGFGWDSNPWAWVVEFKRTQ